jgi:fructosamine-3-kinase
MDLWSEVARHIGEATGEPFASGRRRSVGGGCINTACVMEDGRRRFFVKLNEATKGEMFGAEAEGLRELDKAAAIRVPRPVCWGVAEGSAYLVLEYLEFGDGGGSGAAALGSQLAALHRVTAERYGWHRDNTIGTTPQINTRSGDWADFWGERRLGYQLGLAARRGFGGSLQRRGERLLAVLPVFFRGYAPAPALLHGDLWSGNYAFDAAGRPVIFDPAVYYGDRETDLAMTELFGGFPSQFYAAYREAFPLDPGYRVRKTLYNLYHILNHLNLFGGSYLGQAEEMMGRLLSETG